MNETQALKNQIDYLLVLYGEYNSRIPMSFIFEDEILLLKRLYVMSGWAVYYRSFPVDGYYGFRVLQLA